MELLRYFKVCGGNAYLTPCDKKNLVLTCSSLCVESNGVDVSLPAAVDESCRRALRKRRRVVRTYRGPFSLFKCLTGRKALQSITAVTFTGAHYSLSCLKNLGENLQVLNLTGYYSVSPLSVRNLCDALGRMKHLEEFECWWDLEGTSVLPTLAKSSPKLRSLVLQGVVDNESAAAVATLEHLEHMNITVDDQRSYDTLLTCRSELKRAHITAELRHSLVWHAEYLELVGGVVSCQSGTCNPNVDHLKLDARFVGFGTTLPRLRNMEIYGGVLDVYPNLQTVLSFCPKVQTVTTFYHPELEVDGSAPGQPWWESSVWCSVLYDFGRKEWFFPRTPQELEDLQRTGR